jgi:hypothetical protein
MQRPRLASRRARLQNGSVAGNLVIEQDFHRRIEPRQWFVRFLDSLAEETV